MTRRLAAAYLAAGLASLTYRAWTGDSNPYLWRHVVGGVLAWPVVWGLEAVSPLFDRDDETVDEGDTCAECGQVAPMPWRVDEDWVASHLCPRCLFGPVEYDRMLRWRP